MYDTDCKILENVYAYAFRDDLQKATAGYHANVRKLTAVQRSIEMWEVSFAFVMLQGDAIISDVYYIPNYKISPLFC